MKTLIRIIQVGIMMAQLSIAIIPFILAHLAHIIYKGVLSGWCSANDVEEWIDKT